VPHKSSIYIPPEIHIKQLSISLELDRNIEWTKIPETEKFTKDFIDFENKIRYEYFSAAT
jgi:hypothetical protein